MNAEFIAMTNQNAFIEVLLYVRYKNLAIASESFGHFLVKH